MTQQFNPESLDNDEAQVPLNTGVDAAAPDDYAPAKPRVNNSTVALFGAFAVALVVLYLLGLQNQPRAASAERVIKDTDVAKAIDKLIGSQKEQKDVGDFLDASNRLVSRLQNYFEKNNSFAETRGNPFQQDLPAPPLVDHTPAVAAPVTQDPAQAARAAHTALLRQVAADFDALKLDGIMLGSHPIALINKHSVSIGDQLGYLTVKDIKEGSVLLSFEDQTFNLQEKRRAP